MAPNISLVPALKDQIAGRLSSQIKNRQRVRDLAEVYTHDREVNAMLDLIPDMFAATADDSDIKFLEPACGSGNFLVEILRRKLAHVTWKRIGAVGRYEHRILRALASTYGVDICADNVAEARERMLDVLREHYYGDANSIEPSEGFIAAARTVLATNIVCADMLAAASTTEVIDYRAGRGGTFTRVWSMLDDSASALEPDLFSPEPEPKADQVPVHYSDLAQHPHP
ncbi:MAG TPA: hypothetical protein VFD59_10830, partial [Nocardioidaceae bacterium]|nr:hypothetical protein [Nocardioidaceae bacterium]